MDAEKPKSLSFLVLLRASLLVCAAGATLAAIVWFFARRLRF
jgi:hypothetical protein